MYIPQAEMPDTIFNIQLGYYVWLNYSRIFNKCRKYCCMKRAHLIHREATVIVALEVLLLLYC